MSITQKICIFLGLVFISLGVYELLSPTQIQSFTINNGNSANVPVTGTYIDGTYSGTGSGKNGSIKVSIQIVKGRISKITIVSSHDNPEYYNQAASEIPVKIIKAQSTNVDAVSGATLSSNGIIGAVNNALSKAIAK